jgi:Bacterial PH domain/Short C-terminal domain
MAGHERVLWEGQSQSLKNMATGGVMAAGRYRLTDHNLFVSTGTLRTDEQQIPLAWVQDVDVTQSLTQKARSVGDVAVRVTRTDGTQDVLRLASVPNPQQVRDIINRAAYDARRFEQRMANTQQVAYVQMPPPPMAPQQQLPPPPPQSAIPDAAAQIFGQIERLGELRDRGFVSEEEFQAKKTEMLGRL